MIGILIASTFWQFQQFQKNFRNAGSILPPEITTGIPNSNDAISAILKASQNQPQETSTSTKQFISPDGNLKFDYPSNWQETEDLPASIAGKNALFVAIKTNNLINLATDYLIAEKLDTTNTIDIIDQYKKNAAAGNYALKLTNTELISGTSTVNIQRIEYQTSASGANPSTKVALIEIADNIYSITIISQEDNQATTQEAEKIFDSISIANSEAKDEDTK